MLNSFLVVRVIIPKLSPSVDFYKGEVVFEENTSSELGVFFNFILRDNGEGYEVENNFD